MSLTSSLPGLELDGSIGVFFITGSFALALWAVGCLQLYLYYEKFCKTELPWLKTYVFVIWILDTVHQALIMKYLYILFVRNFGNLAFLGILSRDLVNTVILAATIDAMVQVVFVRRVWYLSNKNFILTGLLSAAVLAQFTATIVYYGQIHRSISLAEIVGVNKTALAFNCISAVMDLGISCTLIWLLWRGRSGFERTDSVLNRLIAYTIGSGLVTEVMWIIAIIGLLAIPNTTVSLLVDPVIPKLYFNCMLASLNARASLQESLSNQTGFMSIRYAHPSSTPSDRANVILLNPLSSRQIECQASSSEIKANTIQ